MTWLLCFVGYFAAGLCSGIDTSSGLWSSSCGCWKVHVATLGNGRGRVEVLDRRNFEIFWVTLIYLDRYAQSFEQRRIVGEYIQVV